MIQKTISSQMNNVQMKLQHRTQQMNKRTCTFISQFYFFSNVKTNSEMLQRVRYMIICWMHKLYLQKARVIYQAMHEKLTAICWCIVCRKFLACNEKMENSILHSQQKWSNIKLVQIYKFSIIPRSLGQKQKSTWIQKTIALGK